MSNKKLRKKRDYIQTIPLSEMTNIAKRNPKNLKQIKRIVKGNQEK